MSLKIVEYWCFAWKLGLKTASYYFRTIAKPTNFNFTISQPKHNCISCTS